MSEMSVPLGVMVATFGTLIGLLIVFRKWLAIRERMIAVMFPDISAPMQALRQPESKHSSSSRASERIAA